MLYIECRAIQQYNSHDVCTSTNTWMILLNDHNLPCRIYFGILPNYTSYYIFMKFKNIHRMQIYNVTHFFTWKNNKLLPIINMNFESIMNNHVVHTMIKYPLIFQWRGKHWLWICERCNGKTNMIGNRRNWKAYIIIDRKRWKRIQTKTLILSEITLSSTSSIGHLIQTAFQK